MPILGKETDLYPADLLDQEHSGAGDWWVMYTMARREKDLMRRLEKARIGFYAPVIARQYRSPAGRLRTSYNLLFANYVFVFGTADDRQTALSTNCISRTLDVPEPQQLVHDLRQIRQVISAGVDLTPEGQLSPGDPVRVRSGPMAGVVGTIVERRGQKRLLIAVDFMQQGASTEVRDLDVEPYTP
ncbi:MAG: hypothetical protein KDA58_08340 [Planctomycetaceae bacterium]|nr:hypothetical protein [Planctomycetaceae bacterium]